MQQNTASLARAQAALTAWHQGKQPSGKEPWSLLPVTPPSFPEALGTLVCSPGLLLISWLQLMVTERRGWTEWAETAAIKQYPTMITSPHLLQWHLRVSIEPCAPRVHPKSLFTEGLWVCLMTDTAAAFNQPSLIFTPLISMKTFMTQGHPTLRLAITLEEVNSDSHYANTEIQHSTLNFHSINNTLSSVYFIYFISCTLQRQDLVTCKLMPCMQLILSAHITELWPN